MSAGGPLHQALTVAACAGQVFPTAKPLRKPAPGILPRASQSSADGFVFRARPSSTRAPTAWMAMPERRCGCRRRSLHFVAVAWHEGVLHQGLADPFSAASWIANPRNIPLEERRGFELPGSIQVGTSPPIFPMLRTPPR